MESQKDLISVIVPVYKVEKYLDKCVESIVNQTYQNLEIILVDDGSPDQCPTLCDKWAEKDCRIKVIHKVNGGSAQARNEALDVARGDYIAFADSDDMMHQEMLSILYNIAVEQQADIVECDYSIDEKLMLNCSGEIKTYAVYDPQSAMQEHVKDTLFRQVIWNKLYKAIVIKKIRFVENKIIDDEFWTYRAIGNASKLVHIQEKLYFYRQQDESVMHQKYSLARLVGVEAHVERHKYICLHFPMLYEKSLLSLWSDCRYHGQMSYLNLDDEHKEEAFEYLQKILKCFSISYRMIFRQSPKEIAWLMIEKVSLKLVCRLRNVLRIGL